MAQIRALVLKNITIYTRTKTSLFFIVMFPILLIAAIGLLQVVVNNLNIEDGERMLINVTQPINFVPIGFQNTSYEFFGLGLSSSDFYWPVGQLTSNGSGSGLLGSLAVSWLQNPFQKPDGSVVQVPFLVPYGNTSAATSIVESLERYIYEHQENYTSDPLLQETLPDGRTCCDISFCCAFCVACESLTCALSIVISFESIEGTRETNATSNKTIHTVSATLRMMYNDLDVRLPVLRFDHVVTFPLDRLLISSW
jgi:hypothetical protein